MTAIHTTELNRQPTPGPDDPARIVDGLRRIVRAIEQYSQDVRKDYGVTGPQLWAMKTLLRQGPLAVGDLAAALAVQPSSLSLLLDRLVQRRLVRRVRRRPDRRFVEVSLTKRGENLVASAPEAAQGRLLHGLRQLSPTELKVTARAVGRLVEIMEATDLEARFFFSDD